MPEEDETEEGRVWGQRVKAMHGTRQSASTWQEEVQRAMCEVNIVPGTSFLSMFHFGEVDGSSLLDEEDFVTVASWWHTKKVGQRLRKKWDVEVQTVGPGLGDSTMSVLKRNPLSWSTQTQTGQIADPVERARCQESCQQTSRSSSTGTPRNNWRHSRHAKWS